MTKEKVLKFIDEKMWFVFRKIGYFFIAFYLFGMIEFGFNLEMMAGVLLGILFVLTPFLKEWDDNR